MSQNGRLSTGWGLGRRPGNSGHNRLAQQGGRSRGGASSRPPGRVGNGALREAEVHQRPARPLDWGTFASSARGALGHSVEVEKGVDHMTLPKWPPPGI